MCCSAVPSTGAQVENRTHQEDSLGRRASFFWQRISPRDTARPGGQPVPKLRFTASQPRAARWRRWASRLAASPVCSLAAAHPHRHYLHLHLGDGGGAFQAALPAGHRQQDSGMHHLKDKHLHRQFGTDPDRVTGGADDPKNDCRPPASTHLPFQLGFRLLRKASMPSRKSSLR